MNYSAYATLNQAGVNMGDLPTWISALAAVILAIITYRYVRLVKAQSDAMAIQSRVMQITMRHERLAKEMDDLVGPLFSKMEDNTAPFFTLVSHSNEGAPFFQEIYSFWRDIKKNIYLAPRDLRRSLNAYLDARQKYRDVKRRTIETEDPISVKNQFNEAIEDLKPKIKDRYFQLSDQLEECEKELNIFGIKH